MNFYLGIHQPQQSWLDAAVPFFISRRRLTTRKTLPVARERWALDSGGFSELSLYGAWVTTEDEYVAEVERYRDEMGRLDWAAPMDWMCEPHMVARTGLTVREHQERTLSNFVRLRQRLGGLVIPVLQGHLADDYLRCWDLYEAAGVDLEGEPTVGLGSVCRRQSMDEAAVIARSLSALSLHGFGIKRTGVREFGDALASADSMAWSFRGRRTEVACPEGRRSCQNCLHFALDWREKLLALTCEPQLSLL